MKNKTLDESTCNEEVFGIIEPALEAAGYTILEGDCDTACVLAPDGIVHFDIVLRYCL